MAIKETIIIELDESDATSGIRKIKGGLEEVQTTGKKSGESIAAGFLKAQVAMKAFNLVVNEGKQAFKSLVDEEKAVQKLTNALKVVGGASAEWNEALQAQASSLEKLTNVADDTILNLQAVAVTSGVAVDEIEPLIKAAISLSNTMDVDVNSAMRSLIKSLHGGERGLEMLIPQVKGLTEEQLRSGEAIRLVNEQMGGQLTLLTEGIGGSSASLDTAWGNLTESVVRFGSESLKIPTILESVAIGLSRIGSMLDDPKFKQMAGAWFGLGVGDGFNFSQEGFVGPLAPVFKDPSLVSLPKGGRKAAKDARQKADDELLSALPGFTPLGSRLTDREAAAEAMLHQTDSAATNYENMARRITDANDKIQVSARTMAGVTDQVTSEMGAQLGNAMAQWVLGADMSAKAVLNSMLASIGTQMISQGTADMLRAGAMTFIPGFQGNAGALFAAGAAELAFGTALAGTARATGYKVGGSRGGNAADAGGFREGREFRSRDETRKGDDGTIVINITGAMSPSETGVWVKQALETAARQGRL